MKYIFIGALIMHSTFFYGMNLDTVGLQEFIANKKTMVQISKDAVCADKNALWKPFRH